MSFGGPSIRRRVPALLMLATTCAAPVAPSRPLLTEREYRAMIAKPDDEARLTAFLAKLPTFEIVQNEAMRRYYVFEGDVALSREEVRAALRARNHERAPAVSSRITPELIVQTRNGADDIWPRPARILTYAIDRSSFPTPSLYAKVTAKLAQAAADWVGACAGCGLSIAHKIAADAAPREGDVTFIVRYVPKNNGLIALGFFPGDPVAKRYLWVFPAYDGSPYDAVGVFRHELGHILGYRHEQLARGAGCYQIETGAWRPLSTYDRKSVMHYWCNDDAQLQLSLSATDIASHVRLYGAAS